MAAGDFTWFTQAKVDLGNKIHNLGSGGDTLKLALVTAVVTPSETDAAPHFGGTGTTNYATNQVSAGGNYAAGGATLANQTFAAASANAKFDADDVSWSKNASNPTNARWGILYNSTDANKRALGFVDLGGAIDMSAYDLTVQWNASGLITIS